MTHRETTCPYCRINTSGTLSLYGEYPCKKCTKEHYHVVDGNLVKKPGRTDWMKCKFCDWKTVKFYTNKKGKHISGFYMLRNHVYKEHAEEMEVIEKAYERDYWFMQDPRHDGETI